MSSILVSEAPPPGALNGIEYNILDIQQAPAIMQDKPKRKYDRHNYAKLKILACCHILESKGQIINSVQLRKMTGKNRKQISALLYHLCVRYPYLSESIDRNRTDGCLLKYSLKKEGRSVYKKLLQRFQHNQDLNLHNKHPGKVDLIQGKPTYTINT